MVTIKGETMWQATVLEIERERDIQTLKSQYSLKGLRFASEKYEWNEIDEPTSNCIIRKESNIAGETSIRHEEYTFCTFKL